MGFQMSEPRIYRSENTGRLPIRSCLKSFKRFQEIQRRQELHHIHTYHSISSSSFEASVPEPMHDWNQTMPLTYARPGHYNRVPCFSGYATLHSHSWRELGEQRYNAIHTYIYILNIRITVGDDYDRGCTKEYFYGAVYYRSTARTGMPYKTPNVLACGTKLLLYGHAVHNFYCTGMRYNTSHGTMTVATHVRSLPSSILYGFRMGIHSGNQYSASEQI